MGISILTRLNNKSSKCLIAICAVFGANMVLVGADEHLNYYESRDQVKTFSVDHRYRYLEYVVFIRLQDKSLHRPQLHFFRGHKTHLGVRKIEKPGDLSHVILNKIRLPTSTEIESYILLLRTSYPVQKQVIGKTKEEYKFTDWTFLEIPAKDVGPDKPITIPPFEEIMKKSDGDSEFLDKLRSLYEEARKEAEKKMNTPVTRDTAVPWYAK